MRESSDERSTAVPVHHAWQSKTSTERRNPRARQWNDEHQRDNVGVQVGQILSGPAAVEKLLFRAALPEAEEPFEITDGYVRFPGRWSTAPVSSTFLSFKNMVS